MRASFVNEKKRFYLTNVKDLNFSSEVMNSKLITELKLLYLPFGFLHS